MGNSPNCGGNGFKCGVEEIGRQVEVQVFDEWENLILQCAFDRAMEVSSLKRFIHGKTGTSVPLQNLQQLLPLSAEDPLDLDVGCSFGDLNCQDTDTGVVAVKLSIHRGPFALTGCKKEARFWDVGTQETIHKLSEGQMSVSCSAADWKAQKFVVGGGSGLMVFDLGTAACIKKVGLMQRPGEPADEITCVTMDSPNKRCLCGTFGGRLLLWDLEGKLAAPPQVVQTYSRCVMCLVVDWESRRAISASKDGGLQMTDLDVGCGYGFRGHGSWVQCMSADWEGKRVLTGSADCTLKLWNVEKGEVLDTLRGHTSIVQCVEVQWSSQTVLSADLEGGMRLWSLASGECLREFSCGKGITCMTADLDAGRAMTGSGDHILRLWSTETGGCLRELQGHSRAITSLAVDWKGELAECRVDWPRLVAKVQAQQNTSRSIRPGRPLDANATLLEEEELALLPDAMPGVFGKLQPLRGV